MGTEPKCAVESTQWQPIATAPKDGTEVLLAFPSSRRKVWVGSYYVSDRLEHGERVSHREGWSIAGMYAWGNEKPEPVLWMPIPEVAQD